nr:MAG TPA: hypothetical protein [Caudoviricetes sp.]
MEKELNIAAILKDKPKGTKLWSPIFGECTFDEISCNNSCLGVDTNKRVPEIFYANGKYDENGECTIFPSKEMRDWEKFAWKKGDVLIGDCGFVCIFKEWASDDYTKFNGCYFDGMPNAETAKYSKLDNNTAYSYIRKIENRCGGKLNLETLEIEKQTEFKDGDIVFMREVKSEFSANCIFILRGEYNGEGNALYHAFYNADDKFVCAGYGSTRVHYNLRPATDEERQRLFDALAKENKKWDAEQKAIVDLPKKCEFKPFDKCVWKVQGFEGAIWQASFISYVDEYDAVPIGVSVYDLSNLIVLPYNEQTKHFLGTTDEWKGDEHD